MQLHLPWEFRYLYCLCCSEGCSGASSDLGTLRLRLRAPREKGYRCIRDIIIGRSIRETTGSTRTPVPPCTGRGESCAFGLLDNDERSVRRGSRLLAWGTSGSHGGYQPPLLGRRAWAALLPVLFVNLLSCSSCRWLQLPVPITALSIVGPLWHLEVYTGSSYSGVDIITVEAASTTTRRPFLLASVLSQCWCSSKPLVFRRPFLTSSDRASRPQRLWPSSLRSFPRLCCITCGFQGASMCARRSVAAAMAGSLPQHLMLAACEQNHPHSQSLEWARYRTREPSRHFRLGSASYPGPSPYFKGGHNVQHWNAPGSSHRNRCGAPSCSGTSTV